MNCLQQLHPLDLLLDTLCPVPYQANDGRERKVDNYIMIFRLFSFPTSRFTNLFSIMGKEQIYCMSCLFLLLSYFFGSLFQNYVISLKKLFDLSLNPPN